MIKSKDRANYFGASDTKFIMSNWNTKTFDSWWLEKLGLSKNDFENKYTLAGNNYEHKIVDSLGIKELEKDKQIIIEELRLRVNLDANTPNKIHEIKTFNISRGFKLYKAYYWQVQVQMFASKIYFAEIDAYGLTENDYKNYFNEIDKSRLEIHEIKYDCDFIEKDYLPRLKYLARCLKKGRLPSYDEFYGEYRPNKAISLEI